MIWCLPSPKRGLALELPRVIQRAWELEEEIKRWPGGLRLLNRRRRREVKECRSEKCEERHDRKLDEDTPENWDGVFQGRDNFGGA